MQTLAYHSVAVTQGQDLASRRVSGEATSTGGREHADTPWSWSSLVADPFILTLQLWALALTANQAGSAATFLQVRAST